MAQSSCCPSASTARSGISHVSQQGTDPQILIDHALQLQNWICNSTVEAVQRKSNLDIKNTNAMVDGILERENEFIREISDTIADNEYASLRKTEVHNKKWNRQIFEPLHERVHSKATSVPMDQLTQLKREIHQEFIDYVDRKGLASLDVYSADEYYPFKLNPIQTKCQKRGATSERGSVLRSQTAATFEDDDPDKLSLPHQPMVPLGRHGTTWSTWSYMPLGQINSEIRHLSRRRMRGDFNKSKVDLTHPDRTPAHSLTEYFSEQVECVSPEDQIFEEIE